MRLGSIILFVALCSFTAYYVYEPIPERIEERWKLMLTNSFFRTLSHLADLCESVGLKDYMDVMYVITVIERIVPVSDEHVKVTEEKFDGVEVVVYQPKHQDRDADLRRAVIYLHGGGWCLGSSRMSPYDLLARKIVTELDAVVLSVEYRLAPAHHFPVPYEDVYRVVKHFLQKGVLAQYSVDPERVAVSGDSAGGNLAAAVSQQLQKEPGQQIKLRAQALLYPVLQALDLKTPSYQQNQDMPILPRTLMVRFWKSYHKEYNYTAPAVTQGVDEEVFGMDGPSQSLADPRASPLLVPDADLHSLPKAYILTCEYDVLRDDGIMYATRLRAAGVEVTHQHYDTGFHGALMFTVWPTDFLIACRMTDNYIKWLKENL
ncbi:arylacetamide deacetylase isoform X3 [Fundulus heteroclitus]|uniref:Neutral cholesterol ester hydrolase 1 n=1 Tax=Fundulus heteroclitus TaxID=8078 RepID=A0A3Q2PSF3_FUNHE|nr:arylacetamide deacetylase isoform X3 [Fundulus heteroclitus]